VFVGMSAPSGPPSPPHNQSPECSNCLGIPDNPFGRPRMMLNMDQIESSESDDSETLDSLSEFGSQTGDDDEEENASSSSESSDNDSGQCSDVDDGGEDDYDRIFNRGVSTTSDEQSVNDETDESDEQKCIEPTTQLETARLESSIGKRRSDDTDPASEEVQAKLRRL